MLLISGDVCPAERCVHGGDCVPPHHACALDATAREAPYFSHLSGGLKPLKLLSRRQPEVAGTRSEVAP